MSKISQLFLHYNVLPCISTFNGRDSQIILSKALELANIPHLLGI